MIESPLTFDAQKIRIAPIPPTACASCFGQYTERLHVDFSAAFDGPVVYGAEGATPAAIDELIICDECLRAAAALLGLKSQGDLEAEIERLNAHADELAERLAGEMVYRKKLEDAIGAKPGEPKKKPAAKRA